MYPVNKGWFLLSRSSNIAQLLYFIDGEIKDQRLSNQGHIRISNRDRIGTQNYVLSLVLLLLLVQGFQSVMEIPKVGQNITAYDSPPLLFSFSLSHR